MRRELMLVNMGQGRRRLRKHSFVSGRVMRLGLVVVLFLFGCNRVERPTSKDLRRNDRTVQASPVPSHDKLVRAASDYARQLGKKVEEYRVGSVRVDGKTASVFFTARIAGLGRHFTVLLDVDTGTAKELIPGR